MVFKIEDSIGTIIYNIRKEQGISQKELASRVSLPQQYISKIEKDKVQIKLPTFLRILHALGKELEIKYE